MSEVVLEEHPIIDGHVLVVDASVGTLDEDEHCLVRTLALLEEVPVQTFERGIHTMSDLNLELLQGVILEIHFEHSIEVSPTLCRLFDHFLGVEQFFDSLHIGDLLGLRPVHLIEMVNAFEFIDDALHLNFIQSNEVFHHLFLHF